MLNRLAPELIGVICEFAVKSDNEAVLIAATSTKLRRIVKSKLRRRGDKNAVFDLEVSHFGTSPTLLRWAKDNGCPWDEGTTQILATNGQLEALKWAKKEAGLPVDLWSLVEAIRNGHLDVVLWFAKNGFPCQERMYPDAVKFGQLEILVWAVECKGYKPHKDACIWASAGRHVNILEWLRQNGYLRDEDGLFKWAMRAGELTTLEWMVSYGYQPKIWAVIMADQEELTDAADWLEDNGYFNSFNGGI